MINNKLILQISSDMESQLEHVENPQSMASDDRKQVHQVSYSFGWAGEKNTIAVPSNLTSGILHSLVREQYANLPEVIRILSEDNGIISYQSTGYNAKFDVTNTPNVIVLPNEFYLGQQNPVLLFYWAKKEFVSKCNSALRSHKNDLEEYQKGRWSEFAYILENEVKPFYENAGFEFKFIKLTPIYTRQDIELVRDEVSFDIQSMDKNADLEPYLRDYTNNSKLPGPPNNSLQIAASKNFVILQFSLINTFEVFEITYFFEQPISHVLKFLKERHRFKKVYVLELENEVFLDENNVLKHIQEGKQKFRYLVDPVSLYQRNPLFLLYRCKLDLWTLFKKFIQGFPDNENKDYKLRPKLQTLQDQLKGIESHFSEDLTLPFFGYGSAVIQSTPCFCKEDLQLIQDEICNDLIRYRKVGGAVTTNAQLILSSSDCLKENSTPNFFKVHIIGKNTLNFVTCFNMQKIESLKQFLAAKTCFNIHPNDFYLTSPDGETLDDEKMTLENFREKELTVHFIVAVSFVTCEKHGDVELYLFPHSDTVITTKKMLLGKLQAKEQNVKLYFNKEELVDSKTLQFYNIADNSEISYLLLNNTSESTPTSGHIRTHAHVDRSSHAELYGNLTNQGLRMPPNNATLAKVHKTSGIAKKELFGLGALALAALAGLHRFMGKPDDIQARAGVAFQRERLGHKSAMDRRDALALLRASGGRVQARTLLGTRAEVIDYLLALRGFQTKKGSAEIAPLCPEEDVRAKTRRLVRRSSAMTREQWVALFPCILEIAITDPDRQGRRRRTDVTCEMISREPWLALGRLPQDTTK